MKQLLSFLILSISLFGFSQQNVIWEDYLAGSSIEYTQHVMPTTDGGLIVSGHSNSIDGDFAPNNGSYDAYAIKYNSSGTFQWKKSFGGPGSEGFFSSVNTSDGGYAFAGKASINGGDVSGYHTSVGAIQSDMWIVKTNSNGIIEWQKCIGGSSTDIARSIEQTNDGGYIICGYSSSNDGDLASTFGSLDYFIVKLTNTGNIQWKKTFGGSQQDLATSIHQLNNGNYILVGETASSDNDVSDFIGGNIDAWVIMLNTTGSVIWKKCFGSINNDRLYNVVQTSDGNLLACGSSNNITWLIKFDISGTIIWQNTYGSIGSEGTDLMEDPQGNYLLSGNYEASSQESSIFILKINSSGSLVWDFPIPSSEYVMSNAITQITNGTIIVVGDVYFPTTAAEDGLVVAIGDNTTNLQEFINDQTKIYPNPALDFIIIESDNLVEIQVFNIDGRLMDIRQVQNISKLDINKYPTGTYFLRAESHVYKFIKE